MGFGVNDKSRDIGVELLTAVAIGPINETLRGREKQFLGLPLVPVVWVSMVWASKATTRGETLGRLSTLVAALVFKLSRELFDAE